MLYSIKKREDLENLNELISLENQVKELRLQDKLVKHTFHEKIKKVFEPVTDTIKNTSGDSTKTMMLTSEENNRALENINDKLLIIMNVSGTLATFLLSLLSKITNPDHTIQYKLVKDPSSSRVNDLLKNKTIPVSLQKQSVDIS